MQEIGIYPSHDQPLGNGARPRLQVLLAAPRGFCAGVRRAIEAVEKALERHGPPVYVRRAIVHNLAVVRSLEGKGAIFVEELDEIPEGSVTILSAHGVAKSVLAQAQHRRLQVYDAVCPLVAKVHNEVTRHHRDGRHVILIGHAGHPEVTGTLGQLPSGAASLVQHAGEVEKLAIDRRTPAAYAVQTTFSVDEARETVAALARRFSDLVGPASNDICYATTNRQAAVKALAPRSDAVIVVGEQFSSNARRLAEVATAAGCASVQLVADSSCVDWALLKGSRILSLTAAASAPESSIRAILDALGTRFELSIEETESISEVASFKPVRIARC